jgi:hypothetical protein
MVGQNFIHVIESLFDPAAVVGELFIAKAESERILVFGKWKDHAGWKSVRAQNQTM